MRPMPKADEVTSAPKVTRPHISRHRTEGRAYVYFGGVAVSSGRSCAFILSWRVRRARAQDSGASESYADARIDEAVEKIFQLWNVLLLYHFDRRFRSQVTAGAELNLFNFCHRSLASGIAVLGTFPAKKQRQVPKNRPKRQFESIKIESKWSQVTLAESTVEMVQ